MADEFKHLSAGTTLTQGEYEAVGGHVFACQETGDIVYASSGSQLSGWGREPLILSLRWVDLVSPHGLLLQPLLQ